MTNVNEAKVVDLVLVAILDNGQQLPVILVGQQYQQLMEAVQKITQGQIDLGVPKGEDNDNETD